MGFTRLRRITEEQRRALDDRALAFARRHFNEEVCDDASLHEGDYVWMEVDRLVRVKGTTKTRRLFRQLVLRVAPNDADAWDDKYFGVKTPRSAP